MYFFLIKGDNNKLYIKSKDNKYEVIVATIGYE